MTKNNRRIIDIDIPCLIHEMLERLDQLYAYTDMSRMVSWSASAGGLWDFLQAFLRNQDCLLETVEGSAVIIDFEPTYSGSTFHVKGHANWHTPDISFTSLPASLASGEEYKIVPCLPANIRDNTSAESSCFFDRVSFKVLCSNLPDMHWDSAKQCFRAIIPEYLKGVGDETVYPSFMTDLV